MTGRVLVVGAGIAGLAAAADLAEGGFDVEVREADDRIGGKIATSPFAGLPNVDEGPDAWLTRVPGAVELAARTGVDELVHPTGVPAAVWYDRLHDIPSGLVLGVPTDIMAFARSGLLSWRGKLRAATEPFRPATDPDDSLGALVRARFGDEVHDRLVDALIGSIYATDTDRSSLASVPQLAALAAKHRSLLLAARRAAPPAPSGTPAPIFAAPAGGVASLAAAVADHVRARGGVIHTGRAVQSIEADGAHWRVDDESFDAVAIATPAAAAARLIGTAAPDASRSIGSIDTADVIMVRLAVPAGDPRVDGAVRGRSGYLVPKSRQRTVTAVSFASEKWAHLALPDRHVLRVSLGRDGLPVRHLDDEAAAAAAVTEVADQLGVDLQPSEVSVTRWIGAFPQYRPHHHALVADVDAALPRGLALAGASYRGIGIPACITDGRRAALQLSTWLAEELLA